MPRLYLFAEGQTEQSWAGNTLSKHLLNFDTVVHPVLIANARKKRVVYRAGIRKYVQMKNDIERFLKQHTGKDVFFTTMIDLYALPADFPGRTEAETLRARPYDRITALERTFADDIDDPRFIPYVQMHEFEALLFVDPSHLAGLFDCGERPLRNLADVSRQTPPELINDNFETAPSKRITAEIPEYAAMKSTAGPLVAEAIGLERLQAACQHFDAWLSRLETLA